MVTSEYRVSSKQIRDYTDTDQQSPSSLICDEGNIFHIYNIDPSFFMSAQTDSKFATCLVCGSLCKRRTEEELVRTSKYSKPIKAEYN